MEFRLEESGRDENKIREELSKRNENLTKLNNELNFKIRELETAKSQISTELEFARSARFDLDRRCSELEKAKIEISRTNEAMTSELKVLRSECEGLREKSGKSRLNHGAEINSLKRDKDKLQVK